MTGSTTSASDASRDVMADVMAESLSVPEPGEPLMPTTEASRNGWHDATSAWALIVPVKRTILAKTRLTGFSTEVRRRLAVAFAMDVVTAGLRCELVDTVTVVTNDESADLFIDLGATVVPDSPEAGLNPALLFACRQVRLARPDAAVAAISSDVASVRAEDIGHAIRSATTRSWFVADAHGLGTTMLAAGSGAPFTPRFGSQSRAEHRALAIEELDVTGLERLRRDVDTPLDLAVATQLGLGRHAREVLADAGTTTR